MNWKFMYESTITVAVVTASIVIMTISTTLWLFVTSFQHICIIFYRPRRKRIFSTHERSCTCLPANLRNFWVSGGRSNDTMETDECREGLTGAPGDNGLNGGKSSDDDDGCSFESDFLSLSASSSLSEPWTRKKASTAGCNTNTAFASDVSASSVRHSPS